MTAPEMVSLVVVGVFLTALACRSFCAGRGKLRDPIIAAAMIAGISMCLWYGLRSHADRQIESETRVVAGDMGALAVHDLQMRMNGLAGMAEHWSLQDALQHEKWVHMTSLVRNQMPGYQAIEWVDSSYHVCWIDPMEGNEEALGLDLAFEQHRRVALDEARDKNRVTVSRVVDLVQGGKGLLIFAPITEDNEFGGFILGVLRIGPWLESVLGNLNPGYGLEFVSDGESLHVSTPEGRERNHEAVETEVSIFGHYWTVRAWPGTEVRARLGTSLPEVVLGLGLVLGVLVGCVIRAQQGSRRRAEELRAIGDASPDLMLVLDEDGGYQEILTTRHELLFQPVEVLLRGCLHDFFPREEADFFLDKVRQAIDGGRTVPVEYELQVPAGRRVFEASVSPMSSLFHGKRAALMVSRDITVRRELEERVLDAETRERERIARDLHDGLGQELTAIELMAEGLEQRLGARDPADAKHAETISRAASRALARTRAIVRGVLPYGVEADGLVGGLDLLAASISSLYGVECDVEHSGDVDVIESDAETQIYRVVQEAATNAVRHGSADQVAINVDRNNGGLQVSVKDNGAGFSCDFQDLKTRGTGLYAMRHRVQSLGGTLDMTQPADGGTLLTCSVPVGAINGSEETE